MKTELWPLSRIKRYAKNPRINEKAVEAVAGSIEEFGFRQPIVVDKRGVIVVGDTRYLAAVQLKLRTIPVHVAHDLKPQQIKAYRIADNKIHEIAEWNEELLSIEIGELQHSEFNLSLLGFSESEITEILDGELRGGQGDPDDVPAPPAKATTRAGDLWILGEHRLYCGDSSSIDDLNRLVAGAAIHLVNTDPPYNVKVEPRSNNAVAAAGARRTHHQGFDAARRRAKGKKAKPGKQLRAKDRPLVNDFMGDKEFGALLGDWFGNIARVLQPGRSFYVWGGYANCANYPPAFVAAGLYFSQGIIWIKDHPVLTRKDFMGNHEWCFYGWKEGKSHAFFGKPNVPDTWELSRVASGSVALGRGVRLTGADGSRLEVSPPSDLTRLREVALTDEGIVLCGATECTDVWRVKKVSPQKMVHLTEKPVELAVRAMHYSTRPGENVLDLFGGSGSTLIAAEQTGRRAFLMELDALYCDVIVNRWEKFTGRKARRVARRAA